MEISDVDRIASLGHAGRMAVTATGSATAITPICSELKARLNGNAVRIPLPNTSLADCVFESPQRKKLDNVNLLLREAAGG